MDLKARIKEIEKVENLTREELARKIDITYTRLRNLVGGQTKFRMEDLEALSAVFPEYEYWIYTGKEMPIGGQISPMTKSKAKKLVSNGENGK